ncbi:MAG: phage portal protein [Firmicutes bacterium]|nr:phage portal protein [Bacillota bacterium]
MELLEKVFYKAEDTDFTNKDVLKKIFEAHTPLLDYYKKNKEYYLGKQAVFDLETAEGKPNNQICVNFIRYITDMECGYFAGQRWKYIFGDDGIAKTFDSIKDNNELGNIDFNHTKNCSIYGHSFELQFIDGNGEYRMRNLLPENVIMIYSDTVEETRIAAIYYANRLGKDDKVIKVGTIYTKDYQQGFTLGENIILEETTPNVTGKVAIVEFKQNEYRKGCFDDIISLIDAYNKTISEKANDVEYFADAYLLIAGADLDETTDKKLRTTRLLYLKDLTEKYDIRFLEKPNADGSQENLLDRLRKEIFTISGVPDMTAEDFGNASGKSLRYRMLALENSRTEKEMQFRSALRQRFKHLFTWLNKLNNEGLFSGMIDFTFYKNIPADIAEEITNAKNLSGIVSQETQLETLSIVDDVKEEIVRINKEKSVIDTFTPPGA